MTTGMLGRLNVELSANTAKFQADLGRAAAIFDRSIGQMQRGIGRLMSGWAAVTAVVGAGSAFGAFLADAIKVRSALDDLADTTGDNVRTLDGMRRQAAISGVEFDQLGGALTKFAKNLTIADEDGKGAASALRSIGLSVEELRAKKPADAMLEVARALNQFEDGAGKVAVATALMGREGAKMLPYLKDLAEAGELNGRITAEQAAQAERAEKEWRRLKQAFLDAKDGIADGFIPAIADLLEQMREGIRLAGSFGAALRIFGLSGAFSSPREIIERGQENIRQLQEGMRTLEGLKGYEGQIARIRQQISDEEKRVEFARFLERQQALNGRTGDQFLDARDLMARRRPALNFELPGAAGKPASDKDHLSPERIARLQAESWEAFHNEVRRGIVEMNEFLDKPRIEGLNKVLDEQVTIWGEIGAAIAKLTVAGEAWEEENKSFAVNTTKLNKETKETSDIARELGLTFTSAFEDAIVGGKKLSEVLRSLEQDIIRLITRELVTKPLAEGITGAIKGSSIGKAVGDFFGSIFGGGKAEGGPVAPGQAYVVGERGPELFVPAVSGQIVPAGAGAVTLNMTVVTPDAASFRAARAHIGADMVGLLEAARRMR